MLASVPERIAPRYARFHETSCSRPGPKGLRSEPRFDSFRQYRETRRARGLVGARLTTSGVESFSDPVVDHINPNFLLQQAGACVMIRSSLRRYTVVPKTCMPKGAEGFARGHYLAKALSQAPRTAERERMSTLVSVTQSQRRSNPSISGAQYDTEK